MPQDGVIKIGKFMETHRASEIDRVGYGKRFVALARITDVSGPRAAIAACVEFNLQGKLKEWAVYFGPVPEGTDRMDSAKHVVKRGEPMSQRDGEHFFPRLDGTYYR